MTIFGRWRLHSNLSSPDLFGRSRTLASFANNRVRSARDEGRNQQGAYMPLGRFLKVLLGGLLALAILFVAAAEYSGTLLPVKPSDYLGGYAAIQQAAWQTLNAAQACAMRVLEWLRNFGQGDWFTLLTGAIALFAGTLWWSTRSSGRPAKSRSLLPARH